MIKAIIFDCFGVIITDRLQILRDELAETNAQAADEVTELIRAVNKGVLDPAETRPRIAALFDMTKEQYYDSVINGAVKDVRLMRFIKQLRGTYKVAMLSNIGADSLRRRFSDAELQEHFDVVVASGDIGYAKPEPEAYEITAERLGVRLDECVFTDDREVFCEAATSVGMHAIPYTNFAQFTKDLDELLAEQNR